MNDVGRIAPLPSSATSVAIHVLPAKIGHHGPAAVETFFSPRVSLSGRDSYRKELGVFATQCFDDGVFASREHNGSESQVAFLRGRQIVSKQPHSFPGYTMYRTHTRAHTDGSHMLTFSSKAAAWQEWELPGMTKKPLSANIEAWIRLNKTIHESSTTASSSSISAS
jgi:hypothetical protein